MTKKTEVMSMAKVLKVKKTAPFGWRVALEIAAAKVITERILGGFVGNANLTSGAVKLGLGSTIKIHPSVNGALLIDGAEDVITALLSGNLNIGLGGIGTTGGDVYM